MREHHVISRLQLGVKSRSYWMFYIFLPARNLTIDITRGSEKKIRGRCWRTRNVDTPDETTVDPLRLIVRVNRRESTRRARFSVRTACRRGAAAAAVPFQIPPPIIARGSGRLARANQGIYRVYSAKGDDVGNAFID